MPQKNFGSIYSTSSKKKKTKTVPSEVEKMSKTNANDINNSVLPQSTGKKENDTKDSKININIKNISKTHPENKNNLLNNNEEPKSTTILETEESKNDQAKQKETEELKRDINEKVKENSKYFTDILKSNNINVTNLVTEDDFSPVANRCCENIIGYKKIPMGISKYSFQINGRGFWVPLCTTEGALVASMCRGIKLLNRGYLEGVVENIGITRSFSVEFYKFKDAVNFYKELKKDVYHILDEEIKDEVSPEKAKAILKEGGEYYHVRDVLIESMIKECDPSSAEQKKEEPKENVSLVDRLTKIGNSTSNYLKVKSISTKHIINNTVFIKVHAYSGEAMGMNMITKACKAMIDYLRTNYNIKTSCLSANICTDKKWSIENYCNGRGRRVFMNIFISEEDCLEVLKVTCADLYKTYYSKICLGSALVLGNFNCQAANYIAALFIALGQDCGQIIESSNCLLSMEKVDLGLNISLLMPSIVVGVLGGGTHLEPSKEFLKQFYINESKNVITDKRYDSSYAPSYLALLVAGVVLAGELSALGALTNDTLMDAHLKLNRI
ncbi:3-hydroxy-3-methylglutaryl-coenzyme A reductase [Hamiltosporidium tvaerminnensis]|uniref:hydroxymethylglutaryl-CoA reductase (NADPH) n=1 Tax=Hamiltosporidium tvaerminnensis TaxID=1176355 RepID=A0A4Q9LB69_9MICR|nr:3-hydroxy-3-methylglutaryl-coenzyme A (HMG-CoA) reductase isozyme [Hamiltosporidium tvaerminnensis]TBU04565.1 3-hydroxy-3-methylglutaryl-coenzyme A reductase [Hamiltosporidium tvaerminnensis]